MIKKPAQTAVLSRTALGFAAFVGILVLVALIGQRHPMRLDLTENKRYTLSEQSRKILHSLDNNVHIKGFFQETDPKKRQVRNLLETYGYYSQNIHYEFIDPDRQPSMAKHYQINTYGTLVLEGFGKTQRINAADEENITNAILKLTQEQDRVVYFLTGHGEREISDFDKDGYSTAKAAMEKENLQVKALNLLVDPKIPEDAALVVVADPQKPLLGSETEALQQYLNKRGSLMVLLEPFADAGLHDFLRSYGIAISTDIIVDTMSRVFGASYLVPVITQYGLHKITEGFNIACFFPTARRIDAVEKSPANIDVAELASTSPYSWSETDYRLGQQEPPKFTEAKDKKGPISVAAVAAITTKTSQNDRKDQEKNNPKSSESGHSGGTAQLAVFGDSDFASNSYFSLQGNSDFFLNSINFLSQQENLITIERSKPESAPLTLSRSQGQLLFWVGLLLMPAVALLCGLSVFRLRRKHR